MERRTLEENRENKRDYAVLVGLRSPVLREDNADEESLAELAALVETAGGQAVGTILQSREKPDPHRHQPARRNRNQLLSRKRQDAAVLRTYHSPRRQLRP